MNRLINIIIINLLIQKHRYFVHILKKIDPLEFEHLCLKKILMF